MSNTAEGQDPFKPPSWPSLWSPQHVHVTSALHVGDGQRQTLRWELLQGPQHNVCVHTARGRRTRGDAGLHGCPRAVGSLPRPRGSPLPSSRGMARSLANGASVTGDCKPRRRARRLPGTSATRTVLARPCAPKFRQSWTTNEEQTGGSFPTGAHPRGNGRPIPTCPFQTRFVLLKIIPQKGTWLRARDLTPATHQGSFLCSEKRSPGGGGRPNG